MELNEKNAKVLGNSTNLFTLTRVVGLSAKDNFQISENKKSGLVACIAGAFITLYDIKKDKQVLFLKNKNNKVFNCLSFSEEGSFLACGEGHCKSAEIQIFSCDENYNMKISLKGHKWGVEKIKFFKEEKYLMSVGDREDKTMFIYSMMTGDIVFTSKYNRPILCFDICDSYLVFGGYQFIKIWNIEEESSKKFSATKFNVDTGKLKDKIFTSCVIFSTIDKRVLLLTSDGHLADLKYQTKSLSRWVHLKTEKGICMALYNGMLVCGCGDGIIRIFKAESLEHCVTLHRPPPLGRANIDASIKKINISVTNDEKFADVIILKYSQFYEKLITVYSDKTFFIWDLKKSEKIYVDRYNAFHSGSINCMDIQETKDDILRLATCSDDKTVKLWNFKLEDFEGSGKISSTQRKIPHIAYSKMIRRIFYFSKSFSEMKFNMDTFISGKEDILNSNLSYNNVSDDEDNMEITALKFSPDEKYIALGDRLGNLYIYDLNTFERVNFASAHNAQINTIDFLCQTSKISTDSEKLEKDLYEMYLIATGSVDNLINIIDIKIGIEKDFENYERSVLSDHQAPVTNVLFLIDKHDMVKLVSCSADRCINFYLVNSASSIALILKFQEEDTSTYCLAYNPWKKGVLTGHNGTITIWKSKNCTVDKIYKMKKGENLLDNFRIAVDKTGSIFATSNNDKYIRIRNMSDGQLVSKIAIAESISSLFFGLNNNYLIAASVEGAIYFFKIDPSLNLKPQDSEKAKIKNKLKLLQRFMEEADDVKFSKNEKVKALIEKMKNSEDVTLEDFKLLDSHFMEKNKNKSKDDAIQDLLNNPSRENENITSNANTNVLNEDKIGEENLDLANPDKSESDLIQFINKIELNKDDGRKSEIIELKEEKALNEEEDDENKNLGNNIYLKKSTIFEKNLKEISPDAMKKSIINNLTRISLTDTYYKKKTGKELFEKFDAIKDKELREKEITKALEKEKDIIYIPKNPIVENIFKKAIKPDKEKKENENEEKIKQNNYFSVNDRELKDAKENKSDSNSHNLIYNSLQTDQKNLNNKSEKSESSPKNQQNNINNLNNLNNNNPAIVKRESIKTESTQSETNNTKVAKKINELQELISNTNKFVDNVETLVNSSNNLIDKSVKKEESLTRLNLESDRTSNIDTDFNNAKPNNVFKNNLCEEVNQNFDLPSKISSNSNLNNNEGQSALSSRFTNVLNINQEKCLYEIAEELPNEEATEIINADTNSEITIQTNKYEVSDTFVQKDKIEDINVQNTFTTIDHKDALLTQTVFDESQLINLNEGKTNAVNSLRTIENTNSNLKISEKKNKFSDVTLYGIDQNISFNIINEKKNKNISTEDMISNLVEFNKNGSVEIMDPVEQKEQLIGLFNQLKIGVKKIEHQLNLKKDSSIQTEEEETEFNEKEKQILEKYLEKYSNLLIKTVNSKLNK